MCRILCMPLPWTICSISTGEGGSAEPRPSSAPLVDYMEEKMGSWAQENRDDYVFISHGDSLEDAEYVRDQIKERFGMERFLINNIGPTIGAHSGPGTIALFFMGEER